MKSWMLNQISSAVVITLSLIAFAGCAPESKNSSSYQNENTSSSLNSNIVGGTNATAEEQKEHGIVELVMAMKDKYGRVAGTATCTGTLIAKNLVLTAAHCLADSDIVQVYVVFATDKNKARPADVRSALSVAIHEAYYMGANGQAPTENESWNDIALLKLDSDAPADFKFVRLPATLTEVKLLPQSTVTLAGYGITDAIVRKVELDANGTEKMIEVPTSGSGVLRKIDNVIVTKMSETQQEIILDQTNSKGACHGDSGGPAFFKSADGSIIQVGVTSRGTNKLGNCNEGAIYTSVASYVPWIAETSTKLLAEKNVSPVAKK